MVVSKITLFYIKENTQNIHFVVTVITNMHSKTFKTKLWWLLYLYMMTEI